MSTHPITKDTDIPFPCWLLVGGVWRHLEGGNIYADALAHVATHYSTNPPDQRPEDVGGAGDCDHCGSRMDGKHSDWCPNDHATHPTPDLTRLSVAAAREIYPDRAIKSTEGVKAAYDKLHAEHVDRASAIISRTFEPMARELAEAKNARDVLLWNLAGCDAIASSGQPTDFDKQLARPALYSVNKIVGELVSLRAENERLRAELEEVQKDANLQRTRLGAILWSGALDKHTAGEVREWTEKYMAELTALRADKARVDWLLGVIHQRGFVGLREELSWYPELWTPSHPLDRATIDAARAALAKWKETSQ